MQTTRNTQAQGIQELSAEQLAGVNGGNSLVGVIPDEFAGVIRWTNAAEYFEALRKIQEIYDSAPTFDLNSGSNPR